MKEGQIKTGTLGWFRVMAACTLDLSIDVWAPAPPRGSDNV